jgi:hypothetical protein
MSAKYIYWVALLLYAISLTLPAFVIHAESPFDDVRYGYEILLVGWAGLFIGQVAWYANLSLPAILLAIHSANTKPPQVWLHSQASLGCKP